MHKTCYFIHMKIYPLIFLLLKVVFNMVFTQVKFKHGRYNVHAMTIKLFYSSTRYKGS